MSRLLRDVSPTLVLSSPPPSHLLQQPPFDLAFNSHHDSHDMLYDHDDEDNDDDVEDAGELRLQRQQHQPQQQQHRHLHHLTAVPPPSYHLPSYSKAAPSHHQPSYPKTAVRSTEKAAALQPEATNGAARETTPLLSSSSSAASVSAQRSSAVAATDAPDAAVAAIKALDASPQSSPSPLLSASPSSSSSSSSHPLRLLLYVSLSVVIAVLNAITWKRTLNRFRSVDGSYASLEFFVTQWTILLYVLLAAGILAYRWLLTDLISDSQRRFPQRTFAVMGVMDAVAGLASSLGGAFTSGQVQTIINQFNIPMTLLFSYAFLASRYARTQYVGAALIVCGSLLAATPAGSSGGGASEDVDGSSDAQSSPSVLWYGPLILLLSTVPNSLSNVYKQHNFQVVGIDVFYLTTAVSTYQVLLGFCFAPLLSLPGLGGLRLRDIPDNFTSGWRCFLGQHVAGYGCHLPPAPWLILLLYVAVNFGYNVLLLLITKHGSALLLVVASAASLPITNIAFTLPLLMGDDAEEWSWWNAAGLLVVVVGFLLYSLQTDAETGDWLPAQGPPGQMVYCSEESVASSLQRSELQQQQADQASRPRRHSFDVTSSPLVIAGAVERKRAARLRYLEQQGRGTAATDRATAGDSDSQQERRVFFTPP